MVTMTACRGCTSDRLHMFLPLGEHPLANGFLTEQQLGRPEPLFSLDAHACLDCGLIQVADQVPAEFFRHYVYVPSSSPQMQRHFDSYSDWLYERVLPGPGALVLDIGCNDGLLLRCLAQRGVRTLGIDPATNIVMRAREAGIEVIDEYFVPELARDVRARYGPAGVITTNNTFHHIGDLDSFTEGVAELLADDGVFVVELPHALNIVEQNQFDGIYHEHVSQFTVSSLDAHLRRFGLQLVDVVTSMVHGGSIRAVARRTGPDVHPTEAVHALQQSEHDRDLFARATYDRFRSRVEAGRASVRALLGELAEDGRKVAAYGASARGNTMLNYYGIGPAQLDYVADRNELKHGLFTPGMHVPVVTVDTVRQRPPDWLLLLAWNFADEVFEQLADYRQAGGRFLVPLPEPRKV